MSFGVCIFLKGFWLIDFLLAFKMGKQAGIPESILPFKLNYWIYLLSTSLCRVTFIFFIIYILL